MADKRWEGFSLARFALNHIRFMGFARARGVRRETTRSPKYKTLVLPVIHFRSSLCTLCALRETKLFSLAPFLNEAWSGEQGSGGVKRYGNLRGDAGLVQNGEICVRFKGIKKIE
jgi:hypothetical protein